MTDEQLSGYERLVKALETDQPVPYMVDAEGRNVWVVSEAYLEKVQRLRAALIEAADDVDSWSLHAGDYLRDKHDVAGEVARYKRIAEGRDG